MAKIIYASTASYCVENARELGIPAALLLDKIVRLSPHTPRKDGFCWYTAKDFEKETSLGKRAFDNAAHKLEEAGIIERKVTYVIGTMERATHFRLLPQNEQTEGASEALSMESASEALSVNTIKKYNKERCKCGTALTPPSEISSLGASQATPARPAPMEKETPFSFGADAKETVAVSVRPDKAAAENAAAQARPYAVSKAVLQGWGYQISKVGAPLAKLVKSWVDAGFKTEEIIEAGKMMKESGDEYWQKATPTQMLSSNGLLWYQTRKLEKNKPKTFEDYQREIAEEELRKAREKDTSFWEAVKKFEAKQRGEL